MKKKAAGFSLIEMLITIVVAVTLIAIAVPNYQSVIASNRLSTTANEYVLAINEARLEAIRRNTSTQVCGATDNGTSDLATACGTTSAGATYALAADPSSEDPIQIRAAPIVTGVTVVSFKAVSYNAQGLGRTPGSTAPYSGLVADLRSEQLSSGTHRCVYMTTGSVLSTCTNNTTCNATTEPTNCH